MDACPTLLDGCSHFFSELRSFFQIAFGFGACSKFMLVRIDIVALDRRAEMNCLRQHC
ncbi:hypothetical protein M758_3G010100 [Ceratodon purpureus]|nr:hypothetical protein M758_3G010100 [Ceratodon purpureus]